jgi:ATP-dependent RNA helicase RhlB
MPLRILRKIGAMLLGPGRPARPAHKAAPVPAAPPPPAARHPAALRERPAALHPPAPAPRPPPAERPAGRPRAHHERTHPAAPAVAWTRDQFQVPPAEGRTRFHDFDLPDEILHAVADLGFQYCTPIQAASLSHALAGRNVAGRAQTGTGKTAAFLIAILTRYLRSPQARPSAAGMPRALVLAPTRELVVQICSDAEALGRYCGLRCMAVYGGMDYERQQRDLQSGPLDLLVATPGRLLDYHRQRVVDLSHVDTLVIDEADRMLDMGFIPDVRRIVRALPDRERRRTLLYSATLDAEVMRLAAQWTTDPMVIEVKPEEVAVATVEQIVYAVPSREKFALLYNLLRRHEGQRVLVFCNRRIGAERLAVHLEGVGTACELLSGDVNQKRRLRVIDEFREGKVRIVIATDVAGRGLHIADIGLVVNYDLPYEPEDYVHRIGRTGRAGRVGRAVSFACEDESFVIPEIEAFIGEPLKCSNPDDALLAPPPRRERRDRHHDRPAEGDRPRHAGHSPSDGGDSRRRRPR